MLSFTGKDRAPISAYTSTSEFKINLTTCKHPKAAQTLKSGLWHCNPERVHRFWLLVCNQQIRGSNSPDQLASDPGPEEKAYLSVAANIWVEEQRSWRDQLLLTILVSREQAQSQTGNSYPICASVPAVCLCVRKLAF